MNQLFVDVSDILKSTGFEKRVKKTVKSAPFQYYQEELSFAEPLNVDMLIRNVGDGLFAEGSIEGKIWLKCDRCLTSYCAPFCFKIEQSFHTREQYKGEQDSQRIVKNQIDLSPLINEELHLWLSLKRLCKDDCRGLCAKCGKNLNEGSCSCQEDEIDPRLRPLRNFFKK